jgi:alpha-D-xyloside xylohydrolase
MKRLSTAAAMALAGAISFACFASFAVCAATAETAPSAVAGRENPNRFEIRNGDQIIAVTFCAEDTVRVQKWPVGGSPEKKSLVVLDKPLPRVAFEAEQSASAAILKSARLVVKVEGGKVEVRDAAGHSILREAAAAEFAPTGIEREKNAYSIRQSFQLTAEEALYGLGQHQSGFMNYRGRQVKLVQANTQAVSPVMVSTAGWGIFWDNYSKTLFDDTRGAASFWSEVADNVDYYVFYGPSIDQQIAAYRQLTGQAPLYGRWAYGYWQSKEHYATQDEILGVAAEYRKRQIPIDNIVQDWNYWGDNDMWGAMAWDPVRYPRPAEMFATLHKENYHVMVSIWAGLGPKSEIHKEMDRNGWLFPTVGWAGFKYFDVYNPKAADLYWQYASKGIFAKGADAWWMDSTEPDMVNALTKEAEEYEMKRVKDNALGSFARYLNTYSLMDTTSVYAHQRQETDQKRVFILTRSTFAGQQRAAATTWSGDIGASWSVYKKQIAAGINHSMAGLPYWTFDIGGYTLGCQGGDFMNGFKDPAYQELYTRMFQFGAFAPIFRSHGSETPREMWEFGSYEPVLEKFDRLRYRLLPYIYSLGWQVTSQGSTIMRGLAMDFTADRKVYNIDDEYMFGPAMLVAPVTEYMEHRPPNNSTLITADHFRTPDGKPGLKAEYFCDEEFKKLCHEAIEPGINLDWFGGWESFITDPQFSIRWSGTLTPAETGSYRFDLKSFGGKHVFIDGKDLEHTYDGMESWTVPVELTAGHAYAFKFETTNHTLGAFRAQLFWKTPSIIADEKRVEEHRKTREVYLPAQTGWFDFWTGAKYDGGQTIAAAAPIDRMPLLVRGGSIVPMGPVMQYSTEKPVDPIELRIYPGADGNFTLYEDENDSYNYEKGVYATIDFHWNDAARTLTIDARKGEFPGMLRARTFHVVVVGKEHGVGVEAEAHPDQTVQYDGSAMTVRGL